MPQATAASIQTCGHDLVTISNVWARASTGVNSAVFMRIMTSRNAPKDLRIVRASFAGAEVVELHDHIHENGIYRMRPVAEISLKAGQETLLRPGGLHIMLIGLKAPLAEGSKITLSLVLSNEHSCKVRALVSLRPVP